MIECRHGHANVAHLLSESELCRDVERHARGRHRLRRLRRCRLLTRTCLSLLTSLRVWLQSPFLSSALFVITEKYTVQRFIICNIRVHETYRHNNGGDSAACTLHTKPAVVTAQEENNSLRQPS